MPATISLALYRSIRFNMQDEIKRLRMILDQGWGE